MPKYTIGLDIGGTKITCGLVNKKGEVIKKIKIRTSRKISQAVKDIVSVIDKISEGERYPIGLGCAGQIDVNSGRVIYSPNMPAWRGVPLLKILHKKLTAGHPERSEGSPRLTREQGNSSASGLRIKIDNDANCFTLAEWKFGAGKGFKNVIGLTLGTGIGSGAVLNGKLYEGCGNAPELGHTTVEVKGRACTCEKLGHLEAYSSGRAIEKQYEKLCGKKLNATDIEKEARQGNKKAAKVIRQAKEYLAVGISNIVCAFDPDVIIFGGSIGIKMNSYYKGLNSLIKKNLFLKNKHIKIKKAKLGEDGGLIGAGLLMDADKLK
ncbi:MAG: ROK family protein [Patescibacteria group bacterium]